MITDLFPDTICGSTVVVTEVPSDTAIDNLNRLGDLRIELNVAKGWRGGSLRFLKKLNNLKGLIIIGGDNRDIDVVQELTNLVLLHMPAGIRHSLNLSQLEMLEDLYLDSVKGPINLPRNNSLRKIGWYCPKQQDIDSLSENKGLTHVVFMQSRAEDLSVLGEFEQLQCLNLGGFSRLKDVNFIRRLKGLRYLDIDTCKGISNLSVVENCRQLEVIAIENVGKVDSLLPVENCPMLKVLSFVESTNILDGKLRFLNQLPQLETVAFQERRHYDAKRVDLPSKQQPCPPIPVDALARACEMIRTLKLDEN